jgi:hypothetical protein
VQPASIVGKEVTLCGPARAGRVAADQWLIQLRDPGNGPHVQRFRRQAQRLDKGPWDDTFRVVRTAATLPQPTRAICKLSILFVPVNSVSIVIGQSEYLLAPIFALEDCCMMSTAQVCLECI